MAPSLIRRRVWAKATKSALEIVKAIGSSNDLEAERSYGLAVEFAEENEDDFRDFVDEHAPDDTNNE